MKNPTTQEMNTTLEELNKIRSAIQSCAEVAAKDWFRRQCQNPNAAMYIWYKPGVIAFWIGEGPLNNNWVLAQQEKVSNAITIKALTAQIVEIAWKLPILGTELK